MKKILAMATFVALFAVAPTSVSADENQKVDLGISDYNLPMQSIESRTTLTVTQNNVNFRATPGGASLGQVHRGTTVTWLEQRVVGGQMWHRVRITGGAGANNNVGREGWIEASFLME